MLDWIQTHIPPWVFIAIVAHLAIMGTVAYLILLERKIASWVQDRIGPNRTGLGFGILPFLKNMKMFGLGQPLADGLKFLLKEDYRPAGVDRVLFTLAPCIMIIVMIVSIAVLPWAGVKQDTHTYDVTGSWSTADVAAFAKDPDAVRAKFALSAQNLIPINADFHSLDKLEVSRQDISGPGGVITAQDRVLATVTYRYPFQIAKLNIGALFIIAVLSLAIYGIVLGGWASNNKYSFLGGLRATAQMVSYEIPLGLSLLTIVLMYGTLDLGELVDKQATYWYGIIPAWNVFTQPLAFLMFLICIHAEANRAPFDLAEAEQELVGGYHTEYSSMRFALFFLSEYAGMITTSAVCVALFFGGWHLPWVDKLWPALGGNVEPGSPAVTTSLLAILVRCGVFFGKTVGVIFVFMWVRWSLPRFRFDQLMMLAWRALIPLSLAMLVMTAIVIYLFPGEGDRAYMRISGKMALAFLGANAALLVLMVIVSRILPPPPETNRKIAVPNSRFRNTPLPAGTTVA